MDDPEYDAETVDDGLPVCPDCPHLLAAHIWADDNKGSYGDFCQVKDCECDGR